MKDDVVMWTTLFTENRSLFTTERAVRMEDEDEVNVVTNLPVAWNRALALDLPTLY